MNKVNDSEHISMRKQNFGEYTGSGVTPAPLRYLPTIISHIETGGLLLSESVTPFTVQGSELVMLKY